MATCNKCGCTRGWDCDCDNYNLEPPQENAMNIEAIRRVDKRVQEIRAKLEREDMITKLYEVRTRASLFIEDEQLYSVVDKHLTAALNALRGIK